MHFIAAETQESTSCDIFQLVYLSVSLSCLWKFGHPAIRIFVNNLFLLAITLLSECNVLGNGNKLHKHMEWNKGKWPL